MALGVLFLDDHKAETLERVVNAVQKFAADNDTDTIKFVLAAGNAGIEAATNQEKTVLSVTEPKPFNLATEDRGRVYEVACL